MQYEVVLSKERCIYIFCRLSVLKITEKTLDSRPKIEYNVYISKLMSILCLQTVFVYVEFETQIQHHFSKCESFLRERERDQRIERVQGDS